MQLELHVVGVKSLCGRLDATVHFKEIDPFDGPGA
jgi:hypothetical protein